MTWSVWRKRVKMIGLLLSIMLLGVWGFSVIYGVSYSPPSDQWQIQIGLGSIYANNQPWSPKGLNCEPVYAKRKMLFGTRISGTQFAREWLGFRLPRSTSDARGHWAFIFPLWPVLIAVGFPTAILWWCDRRPKAGFCRVCKYDLTGNVSGTCSECGTDFER